ncbi:MAG TPA: trypsin-like serine protease [Solirubrobacterales bacterium]|nr:trypsin-like serine protease [Solirubrobacterales bacterium]
MRTRLIMLAAACACLGLCLAGVAVASAASPQAHVSVIGGHDGSIEEFPFMAYLEGESATGGYSCSGTVVAPRLILTAGHCVEDIESGEITPASTMAVATGVDNLKQVPAANISRVSEAIVYPGFDLGVLTGDAGLLVLTAPTSAPPIAIAGAPDAGLLTAGAPLRMAGWGLTSAKAKDIPAQLQQGDTKLQSAKSCRQRTSHYYPVYSTALQLCVLSQPKLKTGVCSGDSGGPAIATRADGSVVEVGVASSVGPACSTKLPNVYTRVDKISAWVQRWIAAIEAGGPRPPVKVPKAHAPFLSFGRAKELAAAAFAHDFRQHFTHAREQRINCHRLGKPRVKCKVSWYQGGNDYYGAVTVYYAVTHGGVGWFYRYTISWVNNHCYFYSGHRASCKIHTKQR